MFAAAVGGEVGGDELGGGGGDCTTEGLDLAGVDKVVVFGGLVSAWWTGSAGRGTSASGGHCWGG